MKRMLKSTSLILFASVVLLSFKAYVAPGIKGVVTPADGAAAVWAVSGTDSLKAVPVGGAFSLEVKPGTYTVVVEAVAPYKNVVKEGVTVSDGEVDLGTITLEQ